MEHTDGSGTRFGRALGDLKRQGCNVLVTGTAPGRVFDRVSARFLGDEPTRVRVFARASIEPSRIHKRLRMAGPGRRPAVVVDAGTPPEVAYARSVSAATTAEPTQTAPADLDVRHAEFSLDAVESAVAEAVADAGRRHGPLGPADLRLCVDSLEPLLAANDPTAVRSTVDAVGRTVLDAGGMAHYVLPLVDRAAAVEDLRPAFDVVVELRATNAVTEQRWTVPDYDVRTEWTRV